MQESVNVEFGDITVLHATHPTFHELRNDAKPQSSFAVQSSFPAREAMEDLLAALACWLP